MKKDSHEQEIYNKWQPLIDNMSVNDKKKDYNIKKLNKTMKGRLYFKENKLIVQYACVDFTGMPCVSNKLEIHPDSLKDIINGIDVEFEIVDLIDGNSINKYAKLIEKEINPVISDDFQIGPDGAFEDTDN